MPSNHRGKPQLLEIIEETLRSKHHTAPVYIQRRGVAMKYEKTPCANSDYKGAPSYGFGLIISPVLTLAPAIIGSSSLLPVVCHSLAMRLYFLLPYISSLRPSTPSHIPLFLSLPQFLPLLSILSRNISNKEIIYIRPLQLPIFPKINFSEILVIKNISFKSPSVSFPIDLVSSPFLAQRCSSAARNQSRREVNRIAERRGCCSRG